MVSPPSFKPDDIELIPDGWEQFERAADTVVKGGQLAGRPAYGVTFA